MRNIFLVSVVATFFLSACSSDSSDFALHITLDGEELSKDWNGSTTTLELDGARGKYSWIYSGYHPNDDFDRERSEKVRLSDEEFLELMKFIEGSGLTKPVNEVVTGGGDMGRYVTLDLEMTYEGQITSSHVEGMEDIWGSTSTEGLIENAEYLASVREVFYFIEDATQWDDD